MLRAVLIKQDAEKSKLTTTHLWQVVRLRRLLNTSVQEANRVPWTTFVFRQLAADFKHPRHNAKVLQVSPLLQQRLGPSQTADTTARLSHHHALIGRIAIENWPQEPNRV
jgi:hypothetical protein